MFSINKFEKNIVLENKIRYKSDTIVNKVKNVCREEPLLSVCVNFNVMACSIRRCSK